MQREQLPVLRERAPIFGRSSPIGQVGPDNAVSASFFVSFKKECFSLERRRELYESGEAGEIYAELDMENWLPEPSSTVGKASVQLWNRSGTPYVSYDVTISLRCTGRSATERKSGTLSNSGSGQMHTVRCRAGNVISATARITRR
jgi:hypothetical protein